MRGLFTPAANTGAADAGGLSQGAQRCLIFLSQHCRAGPAAAGQAYAPDTGSALQGAVQEAVLQGAVAAQPAAGITERLRLPHEIQVGSRQMATGSCRLLVNLLLALLEKHAPHKCMLLQTLISEDCSGCGFSSGRSQSCLPYSAVQELRQAAGAAATGGRSSWQRDCGAACNSTPTSDMLTQHTALTIHSSRKRLAQDQMKLAAQSDKSASDMKRFMHFCFVVAAGAASGCRRNKWNKRIYAIHISHVTGAASGWHRNKWRLQPTAARRRGFPLRRGMPSSTRGLRRSTQPSKPSWRYSDTHGNIHWMLMRTRQLAQTLSDSAGSEQQAPCI